MRYFDRLGIKTPKRTPIFGNLNELLKDKVLASIFKTNDFLAQNKSTFYII
jgi:hypothetical protein